MLFTISKASDIYGEELPYKDAILGWIDDCGLRHYLLEIPDLDALLRLKANVGKSIIIGALTYADESKPKYSITIYDDYIE